MDHNTSNNSVGIGSTNSHHHHHHHHHNTNSNSHHHNSNNVASPSATTHHSTAPHGKPLLFRNMFISLDSTFSYTLLDYFCRGATSTRSQELFNILIVLLGDHFFELVKVYLRGNMHNQTGENASTSTSSNSFQNYKNVLNRMVSSYIKIQVGSSMESYLSNQILIHAQSIQQFCLTSSLSSMNNSGLNISSPSLGASKGGMGLESLHTSGGSTDSNDSGLHSSGSFNNNINNSTSSSSSSSPPISSQSISDDELLVNIACSIIQSMCSLGKPSNIGPLPSSQQVDLFNGQCIQLFIILYKETAAAAGAPHSPNFAVDMLKRIIFSRIVCPTLAALKIGNNVGSILQSPMVQKVFIEISKIINDIINNSGNTAGSDESLSSSSSVKSKRWTLINQQVNEYISSLINRGLSNPSATSSVTDQVKPPSEEAVYYLSHFFKLEHTKLDECFQRAKNEGANGERNVYLYSIFQEIIAVLKNSISIGASSATTSSSITHRNNNVRTRSSSTIAIADVSNSSLPSSITSPSSSSSTALTSPRTVIGALGAGGGSIPFNMNAYIDFSKKWQNDDLKTAINNRTQKRRSQLLQIERSKFKYLYLSLQLCLSVQDPNYVNHSRLLYIPSAVTVRSLINRIANDNETNDLLQTTSTSSNQDYQLYIKYNNSNITVIDGTTSSNNEVLCDFELPLWMYDVDSEVTLILRPERKKTQPPFSIYLKCILPCNDSQTNNTNSSSNNNNNSSNNNMNNNNNSSNNNSGSNNNNNDSQQNNSTINSLTSSGLVPTCNPIHALSSPLPISTIPPSSPYKIVIMLVSLQLTPSVVINDLLLKHVIHLDPTRLGFFLHSLDDNSSSSSHHSHHNQHYHYLSQISNSRVLAANKIHTMDIIECNYRQAYELSTIVDGKNMSFLLDHDMTVENATLSLLSTVAPSPSAQTPQQQAFSHIQQPLQHYTLAAMSRNKLLAYLSPTGRMSSPQLSMGDEILIVKKSLVSLVDKIKKGDKDVDEGAGSRLLMFRNSVRLTPQLIQQQQQELEGIKYRFKITWQGCNYKYVNSSSSLPLMVSLPGSQSSSVTSPSMTGGASSLSSSNINIQSIITGWERRNQYYTSTLTLDPSLVASSGPSCTNNEIKLCIIGDETIDKVNLFSTLKKHSIRPPIHFGGGSNLNVNANNTGGVAGGPTTPSSSQNSNVISQSQQQQQTQQLQQQLQQLQLDKSQNLGGQNSDFDDEGVKICEWYYTTSELPDKVVNFKTFYFSGQEIYQSTHPLFVSPQSLYILTYPAAQLNESTIENWMEIIQSKSPGSSVYLVALSSSSNDEKKIQSLSPDKLAKYPNIIQIMQLNLKNSKQLKYFLTSLHQTATQRHYRHRTPIPYILLRNQLIESANEARRLSKLPITSIARVRQISITLGLDAKQVDDALAYLCKSGDILMFYQEGGDNDSIFTQLIFLDPAWLSKLVSSVFTLKHQNGMLLMDKIHNAWDNLFLRQLQPSLLYLLENFEIMHSSNSTDSTSMGEDESYQIIVPLLFGEERPSVMPMLWPDFDLSRPITQERIYKFRFLPKGFFSRLSVRMLQHFDPLAIWQSGMVIQPEGEVWAGAARNDSGQVKLEYDKKNYNLNMMIRGNNTESGKNLLKKMVEIISSFLMWYFPGRLQSVLVTCSHCSTSRNREPTRFSLDYCETQASLGNQTILCKGVNPVPLSELAFEVTVASDKFSIIPYDELKMGPQLGQGSFATVYRGLWNQTEIAIKKLILTEQEETTEKFREFKHEAEILADLKHENILQLRGVSLNPFCIVTELLKFGDLSKYLANQTESLSWNMVLKLALDIAKGMQFLHACKPIIIHRDLKSANILIGLNENGQLVAKVSDFGLSIRQIDKEIKGRKVWNLRWLAPEIIKNHQYTQKVDVYSYGMVIWEIITRELPFDEYFDELKWNSIIEDRILNGMRPTIPKECLEDYAQLIRDCWHDDPKKRPSFDDIIVRLQQMQRSFPLSEKMVASNQSQSDSIPNSTPTTPMVGGASGVNTPDTILSPTLNHQMLESPTLKKGHLIPSKLLKTTGNTLSSPPASPRAIDNDGHQSDFDNDDNSTFSTPTTPTTPILQNNQNNYPSAMNIPISAASMMELDDKDALSASSGNIMLNNSNNNISLVSNNNNNPISFLQFIPVNITSNINCLLSLHHIQQVWCGCNDGSVVVINMYTKSIVTSNRYADASRIIGMIPTRKPVKGSKNATDVHINDDGDIQIWVYYSDGILIYDPKQPSKPLKAVKTNFVSCLIDDGKSIITNCREKITSIKVYSKNKFKSKKTINIPRIPSDNQISSMAIIHGFFESKVWIGTEKGSLYLLDYFSATPSNATQLTDSHNNTIHTIKKVGTHIWTVSEKQILVFDEQAKLKKKIDSISQRVQSILPHNQYVYASCWDNCILVFDTETYQCVQVLAHHTNSISCLALVPSLGTPSPSPSFVQSSKQQDGSTPSTTSDSYYLLGGGWDKKISINTINK